MGKKNSLRWLDIIATILVAVGAINWGLDALGYNLVKMIANTVSLPIIATIIYLAVGISGIWFSIRYFMKKIKISK